MTLSQTTPSPSATGTRWSKKGSVLKVSRLSSKTKSKTGLRRIPGLPEKDHFANLKPTFRKGKYVFSFGGRKAEGHENRKDLLGGKGANLHGMTRLGLPVPAGFTISTEVCSYFYKSNQKYPKDLEKQVRKAMTLMEKNQKRKFGNKKNPLLVSVRSGAPASMPGMMDTILNLGLNDETVEGLIAGSKDERFSYDSYRRFITMYSDVVLGIHSSRFEEALENLKESRGVTEDTDLTADDLKGLVQTFKTLVRSEGKRFPDDPWEQLWGAVSAVFKSWNNPRATTYRKLNAIPDEWGTAVNVQAMVFGNMGDDCATGVAFTRDPSSGAKKFFGEFLVNAQGEDVVAGIRTPLPINEGSRQAVGSESDSSETLQKLMPQTYSQLEKIYKKLEKHYRDMQDVEFTIESGKLYLLQTRSGKRTAAAAVKIAVDMVREKLITKNEAIMRVQPEQLNQLLHPCLDPKAEKNVIARALPASPGAASGVVAFDPDTAVKWASEQGRPVILVRMETSPEDIHGMSAAKGILTARGGMTSHAAVVARGMGKSCISGCSALKINFETKQMSIGPHIVREGEFLTLDGGTGEVMLGQVPTITPTLNKDFQQLMTWVDAIRDLKVRTNADSPKDSEVARNFGAEGIGLCRTEHMFFDSERIDVVRQMIMANSDDERQRALDQILPMQREDFRGIFKAMKGLPVTIRLLDPPLHEFIPHTDTELAALAEKIGVELERLKRKASTLKEFNPMLGHRGVRLGVSFPEIYKTQVRAIMEAACEVARDEGFTPEPEIMIPLVGHWKELHLVGEQCREVADGIIHEFKESSGNKKFNVPYLVGTMIELPRAALTAGEIAEFAEFFSFGTNDLTQTTYGLSRDDAGMFMKDYLTAKIFEKDPFASLDQTAVGRLLEIALAEGKAVRPGIKIGICGEHGGDPASVEFCHLIGLDYVSCSPFRVPIARLAAAQASINMPIKRKASGGRKAKKSARKTTPKKSAKKKKGGKRRRR